ncbi:pentatricopeptide repeat-containing protein At3g49740 isoform X1 [Cannabis sativa]|uniref:Pentatricopeptide repeat-containing protein n=1 Tax=Cannabis sativa TaxID=3483 RepID=A0A803QUM4_CANSA|nr:pentatricopeptide repeat-containing protein At3g49740 isoform X1 [Cannabis sativa]
MPSNSSLLTLNRKLAHLTRANRYSDALQFFTQSQSQSPKPDHYTISTLITATSNLAHITFGNQLHAYAIRTGLKAFPHVSNTLLSLYAKAQDLNSLNWVFYEVQNPDVYSWTTLLSAYTKLGCVEYACHLFDKMPLCCNVAIWNALITAEMNLGSFLMEFLEQESKLASHWKNTTKHRGNLLIFK